MENKSKSFNEWIELRQEAANPFTAVSQQKGDTLYFGIHDLAKKYRDHELMPKISQEDLSGKCGEVLSVCPVNQSITVAVDQSPFHLGYRKLHASRKKRRKYMRVDGKAEITLSNANLINISDIVDGAKAPVWLVVDGDAKYQKRLLKAIRKGEAAKQLTEEVFQLPHTKILWKRFVDKKTYDYYPE